MEILDLQALQEREVPLDHQDLLVPVDHRASVESLEKEEAQVSGENLAHQEHKEQGERMDCPVLMDLLVRREKEAHQDHLDHPVAQVLLDLWDPKDSEENQV